MAVDFYQRSENIVRMYAPSIRGWLQSAASSSGLRVRSGDMVKGFREKIMKDGLEVWAVKFSTQRYTFMHNLGMDARDIQRNGHSYSHPGYPGRKFIGDPLERGSELLRDRLSIAARDAYMDEFGIGFEA